MYGTIDIIDNTYSAITVFTLELVRVHDHPIAAQTLSPTLHMGTDTF